MHLTLMVKVELSPSFPEITTVQESQTATHGRGFLWMGVSEGPPGPVLGVYGGVMRTWVVPL